MARERANADYFRWRQLGVSSVVQWRVGRLFAGQSPAAAAFDLSPFLRPGDNRLCVMVMRWSAQQLAGRPGYVADERYFPLGMAAE